MQNRPVVLVVDDESITVRLVSFALKALDIDVVGAEDARQALRMIESDGAGFDLVLVDVNLPEVDGFVLVQHLREHPRTQHLPLLIFTARNQSEDEMRARAAGADDFLYKPFSTHELRSLVQRYITGSRGE